VSLHSNLTQNLAFLAAYNTNYWYYSPGGQGLTF